MHVAGNTSGALYVKKKKIYRIANCDVKCFLTETKGIPCFRIIFSSLGQTKSDAELKTQAIQWYLIASTATTAIWCLMLSFPASFCMYGTNICQLALECGPEV